MAMAGSSGMGESPGLIFLHATVQASTRYHQLQSVPWSGWRHGSWRVWRFDYLRSCRSDCVRQKQKPTQQFLWALDIGYTATQALEQLCSLSPATEGRRDCAADVSAAVAEIGIREWKGKGMAFGINTGFPKNTQSITNRWMLGSNCRERLNNSRYGRTGPLRSFCSMCIDNRDARGWLWRNV